MKELLDSKSAAVYLRLAQQTLAQMRVSGTGPSYYKVGRRVLYDLAELDDWLDTKRRSSTSDTGTHTGRRGLDRAIGTE
jgi:hypothetical protein